MTDSQQPAPRKGRGAITNRGGRFEAERREAVDDGWTPDDELAPLRTTLTADASRSIVTRNDSPDLPFGQSINPYRGCEHGCVYCFARPTHAYLGLSPGLDFETRLSFKPDAAKLLEQELRRPGYRPEAIAIGTNTDAYQPVERRLGIMRAILEVLAAYRHPVGIVTKSTLVLRDLDILAPMARQGLVKVGVSITTLDRSLARRLEPRAPTPSHRLEAIRGLAAAGVPTGVMVAPVIPALTDPEIEAILAAARDAGAQAASYVLLRLPLEIEGLFAEWLAEHAPLQARRVMSLMREAHAGRAYRSSFGLRQKGSGAYAEMIGRRFALAKRRLGFTEFDPTLDITRFRPPPRPGDQLALF